jgi:hypothetical protein
MKNFKKIVSLVLTVCLMASLAIGASAANTVDASGGTGTSSVTLSSTADGSIGGDPAATKMSVTVPTVLPVAVGVDGTVSTASDAKITNNSFGAVKVNSVSIEAAQGWNLTAFGDKATLAKEKVDSNKFGFSISLGKGAAQVTDNKNASKQTLLEAAVEGCYMSGVGDTSANSIGITYDAIVTPVSEAVVNASVASVLFVIAWDAV